MSRKYKQITKLILLSSLPLSTILSSCSAHQASSHHDDLHNKKAIPVDYDLGLVTEPINTLNYIKYSSLDKIVPSLVDSFLKAGPNDALKRVLSAKKSYNFALLNVIKGNEETSNFDKYIASNLPTLETNQGTGSIGSSFYSIDNFNIVGGLADDSGSSSDLTKRSTIYAFRNPRNVNNYMAITGYTNVKKNRWSNGDFSTAQDIRDYLEYILDLNTGSQKLDSIRRYGIRAADKFIDAQREYLAKFNTTYKNPFGRRRYIYNEQLQMYIQDPDQQVYQSQNNNEDIKEVEAIKKAASELGFYTGQLFLDFSNKLIADNLERNPQFDLEKEVQDFKIMNEQKEEITVKLVKNPYVNPYQKFNRLNDDLKGDIQTLSKDENSFTLIFDENLTPSLSYLVATILQSLYPINRRYVETEGGGIDKYGSEPSKFLTNGPFIIPKNNGILLGPNGYISLEKNRDYFDAENTISNKIKILFSQNRNTNALFFEDGYISQTYIPANRINQYWADPEIKKYLNKNQGYGTIAFGFNLDLETNANSYLQDQDLRNAIYYALNRDEALKFVGWDFSFPVNTWTAYGQHKAYDGKNLELYFESQESKAKNNKTFPLQNYEFVVHLSKGFNFEKTQRHDLTYDVDTAQFYLERFKNNHKNLSGVTLNFLNNSTDEQQKAGTYLKEALNKAFNGYINIEIKSLPENIFASFIEKGQYDIIYQNYDRFSGGQPQDSVLTFFKQDGVDTFIQKNIGFKENPVGSYTYTEYLANLIIEALKKQNASTSRESLLDPDIKLVESIINSDPSYADDYQKAVNQKTAQDLNRFTSNHLSSIQQKLEGIKPEYKNVRYSIKYLNALVDYFIINQWKNNSDSQRIENIKTSRLHTAFNLLLPSLLSVDQIANLTNDTQERLDINQDNIFKRGDDVDTRTPPNFWKKFIELALPKYEESSLDYSSRLSSFFSGNFNDQELKENWETTLVYQFIASLEKIIRDAGIIVPLMEVDTNWEVTKVGGVDSLYRFALQYAYDYTRPPREGLPRTREV
ncbi:ABC transporter substrate-binding protein [Mycoplasma sp. E35C]|uniref:ABC transporter substrate-binding protein n=1 Tax=Mycoplasma sp. E35C TaxID=2801918 RepID=UPI001CA38A1B|nr:ABC transporter substrate-binding protein [Mycoplasma sp. E35C]QZX48954.1 peptide ABC transporter substrate-binding protein [Mycoplasma sp. E35C]